jgi:quercetin dioxygenase-like cupin family protein
MKHVREPKAGARDIAYEFESLDYPAVERRLNGYYVEFLPVAADKMRLHRHEGGEFIYVLSGTLMVQLAGEGSTLSAGDSMYFDACSPHGYRRIGAKTCAAIVVTSP